MPSIFSRIIAREAPGFVLWEDHDFALLLDIHPINPGHTLLVPKLDVDSVYALPEALYEKLWRIVRDLEPGLRAATNAVRIGIAIEGFGVPHAHVHLVPVNAGNELNPERARRASDAELEDMALRIRAVLETRT